MRYDQGGSTNYNAAPQVTESVTVTVSGKTNQTITFGVLANKTYGEADFTSARRLRRVLRCRSLRAVSCTVSGTTVHLTGSGSCAITASQAGDASYDEAASISQSFTIAKAGQTLTFGALASKSYGEADFTVGATASSGLAVSFAASGSCTVSGATVHLTGAGSCTITRVAGRRRELRRGGERLAILHDREGGPDDRVRARSRTGRW